MSSLKLNFLFAGILALMLLQSFSPVDALLSGTPVSTHLPPGDIVPPPYVQGPGIHSSRMATRVVWGAGGCEGFVNYEMPFGFGPANACMKVNGGRGWSISTCSNNTGLVTYYYSNPACTGSFNLIEASAIRTCRYDYFTMSYWADFCGSEYSPRLTPSITKTAIIGDGAISARHDANAPCSQNSCPPKQPYTATFASHDCRGSNSSVLFYRNLSLSKCYLLTASNRQVNLQATCAKGLLILNEFESGCDASTVPIQTAVYPTDTCVRLMDGSSARYLCGNS